MRIQMPPATDPISITETKMSEFRHCDHPVGYLDYWAPTRSNPNPDLNVRDISGPPAGLAARNPWVRISMPAFRAVRWAVDNRFEEQPQIAEIRGTFPRPRESLDPLSLCPDRARLLGEEVQHSILVGDGTCSAA